MIVAVAVADSLSRSFSRIQCSAVGIRSCPGPSLSLLVRCGWCSSESPLLLGFSKGVLPLHLLLSSLIPSS